MSEGRWWLFRAVDRGWIKAESLFDGSMTLARLELIHEALDVSDENQRRIREYYERHHVD